MYLPYLQPDLTDAALAAAEAQFGCKLPEAYIELLRIQNGGYINYTIKDSPHTQIWGIGPHAPSITEGHGWADRKDVRFPLEGLIPFDGNGDWFLCMDYRNGDSLPQATFVNLRHGVDKRMAPSFEAYLSVLEMAVGDECAIVTDDSLEAVMDNIESLLGVEFGELDSSLHGSVHAQIWGIGPYFPSITDDPDWEGFEDASFALEGLIPFDGDGHWFLCLDYRDGAAMPPVTYVDLECDEEKRIAPSFQSYLTQLVWDIGEEYALLTKESLPEAVAGIEGLLGVQFEEPDANMYGYPVYRAQYRDSWVFLSPNLVANGFIRENERRYDELKALMEGTALRYPFLPENALVFNALSEEARENAVQRLAAHYNLAQLKTLLPI
jgi:hypothetical protein